MNNIDIIYCVSL